MKKFAVLAVLILCINLFAKDVSWFKCFKGKIGDYPVTVYLNMHDNRVTGYYYYDKYLNPFPLMGDLHGDTLSLGAYITYSHAEIFEGIFRNSVYTGEWSLADTDKKMSFRLDEDKSISAQYEYVFVKGEKKLFKNFEKSPGITNLEGCIWPTDKNPNKEKLRSIICEKKGWPKDITLIGAEMLKTQKKYFDDYFKINKDLTKNDIEDMGWTSTYNVDGESHLQLVCINKNMLLLSYFGYEYTGGAHGNYSTGYSVVDMRDKTTLKLEDVLTKEGIFKLPDLLDKNFRIQNNVPDTTRRLSESDLFVDTIYATENFILTPGCMMFGYPPYDIASYAAGEVKIYIPINEVEKYLKPKALQLIKQD